MDQHHQLKLPPLRVAVSISGRNQSGLATKVTPRLEHRMAGRHTRRNVKPTAILEQLLLLIAKISTFAMTIHAQQTAFVTILAMA